MEDGAIAVVLVDESATIKRYRLKRELDPDPAIH